MKAIVGFFVLCFMMPSVLIPVDTTTDPADENIAERLASILAQQQADWNAGDIPAFMRAYWKSESLTFSSGGETHRGWQTTHDRYLSRYPNAEIMGKLEFTNLETQQLANGAALTLGRWKLTREDPIGGNFSLVWKQVDGKWKIVHDHTSVLEVKALAPESVSDKDHGH